MKKGFPEAGLKIKRNDFERKRNYKRILKRFPLKKHIVHETALVCYYFHFPIKQNEVSSGVTFASNSNMRNLKRKFQSDEKLKNINSTSIYDILSCCICLFICPVLCSEF